jgi:hypothetical protein
MSEIVELVLSALERVHNHPELNPHVNEGGINLFISFNYGTNSYISVDKWSDDLYKLAFNINSHQACHYDIDEDDYNAIRKAIYQIREESEEETLQNLTSFANYID